jgi:aerobic-type carbon monoxide dehydrogenase small subunit (CoxS/CutS family)
MNAEDPHQIKLTINRNPYELSVPARRTLVDMLRYDIGLTGTKEACSVGVCGACTVMIDGRIVASCITLAVQADGADLTTIEGIGSPDNLSPVQQAFIDCGGFQCGICTPGQIVAATALLENNAKPNEDEIKEWLMGNLCRCTGYYQIIDSVKKASGQPVPPTPGAAPAGQA